MVNITINTNPGESAPGNIANPRLRAAFAKLEKKEKAGVASVKESRQYHRLKKHGDNITSPASITGSKPSPAAPLAKLNTMNGTPNATTAQKIVDEINNGLTVIQACEKLNIAPKVFYKILDDPQNLEVKIEFMRARCLLAEYYIDRRERLESDLKAGRIDPSTYTCLSSDYKYLAAKLAPLAYGDKIQLDAIVTHTNEEPSRARLEELNKLITDASYTID